MHRRIATAAAAVLLATVLTACGGDGEAEQDPKTSPKPTSTQTEAASGGSGETPAEQELPLGKGVETIGSGGTGALEVTPDTVVYAKQATGEEPENGTFAVVAVKLRPTNAVAAAQAAPIDGGGWQWIAPDGQATDTGSGTAFNVVPNGFDAGGEIQPGTHEWGSAVFDLTEDQAKGGTLMYVDGEGAAYRWKIPAQDSGPQVEKLKQALQ